MNQLLNETEPERPWQLEYADDSAEAIDQQLPQADGMAQVLLADLGDLRRQIAQERRRAAAAERECDELHDQLRAMLQFVACTLAGIAGPVAPDRGQWRLWLSQTLIALALGLLILGAVDYLVFGDAIPILSEPSVAATPAAHGP
jgi:hypothetical protein